MNEEQATAILKELEVLRKLKLLELLDKGYSQGQLAKVLGVSQPTISRMVPNVTLNKKG
jgi:predicted transcriptional regulator